MNQSVDTAVQGRHNSRDHNNNSRDSMIRKQNYEIRKELESKELSESNVYSRVN